MHLLLAPFLAGVVLVQARQVAVIALVEREIFPGREAGLADLGKDQIERVLGARQHRGEGDVERETLRLQFAAGVFRLGNALFGEIGVLPAGEEILQIPFALAMPHEHKKTIAHFQSSVLVLGLLVLD